MIPIKLIRQLAIFPKPPLTAFASSATHTVPVKPTHDIRHCAHRCFASTSLRLLRPRSNPGGPSSSTYPFGNLFEPSKQQPSALTAVYGSDPLALRPYLSISLPIFNFILWSYYNTIFSEVNTFYHIFGKI